MRIVYTVTATLSDERYERNVPASSPEAAEAAMHRAFPGYQISEAVKARNQDSFSEMD